MQSARLIKPRVTCGNDFRPGWTYQRLPAGDAMLEQGKGLSPAFFNLLDAVDAKNAVTFSELHRRFPRLHADDLELWLAELCRMALIAPAAPVGAAHNESHAAPARETRVSETAPLQPQAAKVGVAAAAAPILVPAAATYAAVASDDLDFLPKDDLNFLPVKEAPRESAPALADWKHKSLDALYNELLAICAELEAREAPMAMA